MASTIAFIIEGFITDHSAQQRDGRTEIIPCVLKDIFPFQATAMHSPSEKIHHISKQGKGIAEHYCLKTGHLTGAFERILKPFIR